MDQHNMTQVNDAKQFLVKQRTEYANEIRDYPTLSDFLTQEGIDKQIRECTATPVRFAWGEIREHAKNGVLNVSFHQLELPKEQAVGAGQQR